MIKVKLYKTDMPVSANYIKERVNNNLYDEQKGFGFHIIKDDDDLEVMFTLRSVNKQQVEYANGEHSEIETVSYLNVKFCIMFDKGIAMYALNPPLSMKIPYAMIHKIFGESSGLKPIELDLKKLVIEFSNKFDLKIKSVSFSNIQLDAFTLAKTKIVSSQKVSDFHIDSYMNTSAILDAIHFTVNGIETELSRTGRFRVRENQLSTLLAMLENN
jgi:hypothetical protein